LQTTPDRASVHVDGQMRWPQFGRAAFTRPRAEHVADGCGPMRRRRTSQRPVLGALGGGGRTPRGRGHSTVSQASGGDCLGSAIRVNAARRIAHASGHPRAPTRGREWSHLEDHRRQLADNGALVSDQGLKFGRGLAERVRRLEAAHQQTITSSCARGLSPAPSAHRLPGDRCARLVAAILLEQAIDIQRAALQLGQAAEKSASK